MTDNSRRPTDLPPPHADLRISVVVPAKDEEALIGACLEALAVQKGVQTSSCEVLLVLDGCTDRTEDRALQAAAEHPGLRLHLLDGPGRGAGHARRVGMEAACERLFSLGRPGGLIASTDADTVVAPDWLRLQLEAAGRGARAIGGRIMLADGAALPEGVDLWREEQGQQRHLELLAANNGAGGGDSQHHHHVEHWQFSGASLALTAEAYAEVGGLEPRAALEDEGLERALTSRGIEIQRPLAVTVTTSARLVGRATRGLARDLALASWVRRNTFDARDFDPEEVTAKKQAACAVSAVVPARGEDRGGTATLLEGLRPLVESGLVDEVVVLVSDDAPDRFDGARWPFAGFHRDRDFMPRFGPVRGYGDVLWRGLSAVGGDIVLFLDPAESSPKDQSLRALGLLAPMILHPSLSFVKGYADEPTETSVSALPELVARPLLNLYRPELAGFVDPLSPELAARTDLLRSLPFPVGPGVSLSLLLDAAESAGVGDLAQVCLGRKPRTDEVPLDDLTEAAHAIMAAAAARAPRRDQLDESAPGTLFLPRPGNSAGFTQRRVALEERPPLIGVPETG